MLLFHTTMSLMLSAAQSTVVDFTLYSVHRTFYKKTKRTKNFTMYKLVHIIFPFFFFYSFLFASHLSIYVRFCFVFGTTVLVFAFVVVVVVILHFSSLEFFRTQLNIMITLTSFFGFLFSSAFSFIRCIVHT